MRAIAAFIGGATAHTFAVRPADFTPPGGGFPGSGNVSVTIRVSAPATKFRYTINDPVIDLTNGTLVSSTFITLSLAPGSVLRAIAIDDNNNISVTLLGEYDHNDVGGGGGHPPGAS